jgi:ubiquinone/menaquinone biosynthesis C-methylase UbiE
MILWRAIEAQVLSKVRTYFQDSMLDLGCGDGKFSSIFFGSNANIAVGCDLSAGSLRQAKAKGIYRALTLSDARILPYKDESFSTVFSNSVIEHITNDESVLKEVARALKPCGRFVFTVPSVNLCNYLYYPRVYRRRGNHKRAEAYIDWLNRRLEHRHYHSLSEWRSLLQRVGLRMIYARYYSSSSVVHFWDRLTFWATRKIGPHELNAILSSIRPIRLISKIMRVIFVPVLRKYYESEKAQTDKNKDEGGALLIIAEKVNTR